jgi:hypothetical protein
MENQNKHYDEPCNSLKSAALVREICKNVQQIDNFVLIVMNTQQPYIRSFTPLHFRGSHKFIISSLVNTSWRFCDSKS